MALPSGFITLSAALMLAVAAAAPAEARLSDPGMGGAISGGLFGGVRLGPNETAAKAEKDRVGVVGENCYLRTDQVRTSGGTMVRSVMVCE